MLLEQIAYGIINLKIISESIQNNVKKKNLRWHFWEPSDELLSRI